MDIIRHIPRAAVFGLKDEVECLPGQIVSKTIAQNEAVSLTLFAFDTDEEIGTHESSGDALVCVLSGTGEITIADEKFVLHAGQSILMPARTPHAVRALEPFKMALTVVFAI